MRPEELKERRAKAGLAIKRLSEISGVGESTIGRIEHGYKGARERTLSQLEQALDDEGRAESELLEALLKACKAIQRAQIERVGQDEALDLVDAAIQKAEGR